MSRRERARREIGSDLFRQLQQSHEVGDRAAVFSNGRGDLFLRQREIVGEPLIRQRFIDRIEAFSLKVLDERELEKLFVAVGNFPDNDWDTSQPRSLRRAPSPLASNDSIGGARAANQDRLNDAVGFYRRGQLLQPGVVHVQARLLRVWRQQIDVDVHRSSLRGFRDVGISALSPLPRAGRRSSIRFSYAA